MDYIDQDFEDGFNLTDLKDLENIMKKYDVAENIETQLNSNNNVVVKTERGSPKKSKSPQKVKIVGVREKPK